MQMPSYLPKRCKTAMAQLYIRMKVSSEKSVIYMHKHQNMRGENETLQFPRCTVAFTTFLHQTPCGFAWCLFPPGERESLPRRLIRHKDSPRGPADQSAPGQDRTYQKRTSTKTLLLLVFSRCSQMSLCDHPKLSDWLGAWPRATNTD